MVHHKPRTTSSTLVLDHAEHVSVREPLLDHAERASARNSHLTSRVSSWLSSVTLSSTPSVITPRVTPPSSPRIGEVFTAELTADDLTIEDLDIDDAFEDADRIALHAPPCSAPRKYSKKDNNKVAYVVFNGRKMGVFQTWAATDAQVWRFSGQRYKGYQDLQKALDAWEHAKANGTVGPIPTHDSDPPCLRGSVPHPPPVSHVPPALCPPPAFRPPPASHPPLSLHCSAKAPASPPPPTTPGPWPYSRPPPPGTPHPHAMHPLAQFLSPKPLTDEETYFVVYAGVTPGVYLGRVAAKKGMGHTQTRALYKTGSEVQANRLYVYLSMHKLVVEGIPLPPLR